MMKTTPSSETSVLIKATHHIPEDGILQIQELCPEIEGDSLIGISFFVLKTDSVV
jgi:hypothetical protein